ncbi:hypothetical protein [Pandoraea pulmonicola]|uniref:hypothetical protein n=1 Tax=Pandoraea pulmonicola TaxID=93221 RepID=UPI0013586756|nr:hypothetical protein [Pandoraea pulmonicola]
MSQSMSTSTRPATVGVNARLAHQTDQTTGGPESRTHAGVMDALLDFVQQPPSPGTSQLLGRFEAIQEGLEQRVDPPALIDMPSGLNARPPSLASPALIGEWMLTYMDVAPVPPVNAEVLACMPSSSCRPQHLPATREAEKRAAPQDTGSGAGVMPPPIKAARQRVDIQTLRALHDALTSNPTLDVTEWARTNRFNDRTIRHYVYKGALTPEAWNRLDLAEGRAPRLRKVGREELRALRDALADNPELDAIAWARANHIHFQTVKNSVRSGALTPEAQNRLDVAEGTAPRFRPVGVDDLRALRDALAENAELDLTAWARGKRLHRRTLESYVLEGALTPEGQNRLDVADGKAPRLRRVEVNDLRALRDALAGNAELDVAAWARAHHLNCRSVRSLVRHGALRPEALKRLLKADGRPVQAAPVQGERSRRAC